MDFKNPIVLGAPVFSIEYIDGYLVLVSGGGGKKFGIVNSLESYKTKGELISEKAVDLVSYPDSFFPNFIRSFKGTNNFTVCSNNIIVLYDLKSDGKMVEISRILKTGDAELNLISFDSKNEIAIAGDSFGDLTKYAIEKNGKSIQNMKLVQSANAHTDKLLDILVLSNLKVIISCSSDATCKVLDISNLKQIHYLSFKPDLYSSNLIFRSLSYDGNYLFTLQSPMRGSTYITKWRVDRNFEPEQTKSILDTTGLAMRKCGNTLVVGAADGSLIHINSNNLENLYQRKYHEMAVRSITSAPNNKVCFSSSPDQMISGYNVVKSSFISISNTIKLILLAVLMYAVRTRFIQLNKIE